MEIYGNTGTMRNAGMEQWTRNLRNGFLPFWPEKRKNLGLRSKTRQKTYGGH